jgi:hypothetical protein
LRSWSEAALTLTLGRPFFEVNAIGALRHALGMPGAEPPADDFFALKTTLESLRGRPRQDLQVASRTNQARAVLGSVAAWNQSLLDRLSDEADALRLNRERQRDRLRHARDGLARRLNSEQVHLASLVKEELSRGWERVAKRLTSNASSELEQKSNRWFDTYLEEAVRAAERQANGRLGSLALEADAPPPDPMTVMQFVSLGQRSEVNVPTPVSSGTIAAGVLGATATGAVLGSFVPGVGTALGAVFGFVVGSAQAGLDAKKSKDHATAYSKAARTDWDRAATTVEQLAGEQFKARLDALLKSLGQRVHDLERTLPVREERDLRRKLQAILMRDGPDRVIWRFDHQRHSVTPGKVLRLETHAPAVIRWSSDGWKTCHDTETRDTGLDLHVADLPTRDLPAGSWVQFTFRWPESGRWEGRDFAVEIVDPKTSFGRKVATNNRSV